MISVSAVSPKEALQAPWSELTQRAANVFMNPVALMAAQDTIMCAITVLLAWEIGAEPARLVGLWALRTRSFLPPWPSYLDALPYPYAFISTPVVDPAYAAAVVPAFFDSIASHPRLPKVIWMQDLDAAGPVFEAMRTAASAPGYSRIDVKWRLGPVATREEGPKTSGSTRRKLRQDWNRLSRLGTVAVSNARDGESAIAAMETFLKLEASGWKGRRGTALLSNARDATFARRFVGDLAAKGDASVALLMLDGQPIAAQVLLYCGRDAYTWKPAFDESFAAFSPGMLLVDRITTELLGSGDVDIIDSCATEESFMGRLFSGRKPVTSQLVNLAPRRSAAFIIESAHRRGHEMLRSLRDRLRRRTPAGAAKRSPPPAGRGIA